MKTNRLFFRLAAFALAFVCLTAYLYVPGGVRSYAASASADKRYKVNDYLERAREYFEKHQIRISDDEQGDPDEVLRVMVETDIKAAVDVTGDVEYTEVSKAAEASMLNAQESIISRVEKLTGNKVLSRSAYLVNAFSIEMTRAQMKEVEALEGVKAVYPVTSFQQSMHSALDMTSATKMWEQENGGFTGEGIVIAIIDTGINWTHPDMKLDEGADVKYTKEDMLKMIEDIGYGEYYSDKVPFGYCYGGGLHPDINNKGVDHGLHVSGIAAANGDEENGGIKGVAPNAQLLALQTFSDSGQGFNDDMIKAVEDAVKLGADIINMSLGSTAGFYNDVDYLQKALSLAEENGILCCVAAGNDGTSSSDLGVDTNDWNVVDTGSISAPATYPGALSVASVDNLQILGHVFSIYAGDEKIVDNAGMWDFSEGSNTNWNDLKDVYILDCGYGSVEEVSLAKEAFQAKADSENAKWVALIQRGSGDPSITLSFEQKILNSVILNGASAAVIYNNVETDEIPSALSAGSMNTQRAVMISGNLGIAIKKYAENAENIFKFEGLTKAWLDSAGGGGMSEFSSWGPTPTLDIKPEISAPGGNIYSISFGNGYATYSGTSMATPYISGSSAIVLQALKKAIEDGELKLGDNMSVNLFLKQTLMNTADTIMNGSDIYSVRRQGSGMVDPLDAACNRVLATYEDGLAAIALKEVGSMTKFRITLTNYGTKEAKYTIPASETVYTDYTDPVTKKYSVVRAEDAIVTFDKTEVTVPAGGSAEVTGTLTLGSKVEKDHFVEAYVHFNGDIDLSLPLLGFYGDWAGAERIIDNPAWESENVLSDYYLFNGTSATTLAGGNSFLGILNGDAAIDPEKIAFSPNGDFLFDTVMPLVGQLRSAETMTVDILDENGNVVRQINALEQVAKTLGIDLNQSRQPFTALTPYLDGAGSWNGTKYDVSTGEYVLCDEGQYYVRIRATLPGSDRVEETILPVKLDLTAPETVIHSAGYTDGKVNVKFSVSDFSGVSDYFVLFVNGTAYYLSLKNNASYDSDTDSYTVSVDTSTYRTGEMNEIAIVTIDYAQVEGLETYYTDVSYDKSPVLFSNISNGDELSILTDLTYTTRYDFDLKPVYSNISAQIRGTADESVASITINGEKAVFDSRHGFRVSIPVETGYGTINITASDKDGNEIFKAEKQILTDLNPPSVNSWVADKNGEWDEDMIYASYDSTRGYVFATKYDRNTEVPIMIDINDEAIESVTISWHEGDLGYNWPTLLNYHMWSGIDEPDPLPELLKSRTYTAEEIKALDGKISMTVPFFSYIGDIYHKDGTAELGTTIYEQVVVCTARDVAGNVTVWNTLLEEDVFAKSEYEIMGDNDVRDNTGETVWTGFVKLDPIWDGDLNKQFSVAIITPDMVDENDVLHFRGVIGEGSDEMYMDGKLIEPTLIDGELVVEFDRKLQPGFNTFWAYFNVFLFNDPNQYISFGSRIVLFYLDSEHPLQATYRNEAISDGAVIYTNGDVFTVDGEMTTIYGGIELEINGEQLMFSNPSGVDVRGSETHGFKYDVALKEGVNIIKIHAKDGTNDEYAITFTVIRDTVAPEMPSITEDNAHNVTVAPVGDETVTLYYSMDGETWTVYNGPLAVTESGTVYAKAVDAAGNESEIAKIDVEISAPEPDDPGKPDDPVNPDNPDNPDDPGNPETVDNGAAFTIVAILVTAASALIALIRKKRFER